MRPSRLALLVAFVLNVAACTYHWPTAPAVLWSHFNASGVPDGRMVKRAFFLTWIGLGALPAVVALVYGMLLPRLGADKINMPHKELWLAPERREGTLRDLAAMIEWLMAATSLFILAMQEAIVAANGRVPVALDSSITVYVIVLLSVIAAVIARYLVRWSAGPER